MPKPLKGIVIVLALILTGAVGYVLLNGGDSDQAESFEAPETSETTNSPSDANSTAPTAASGAYEAYSADAVAATSGQRILFFHAPWCPQCRALDASIEAGKIPDTVTIFKVDYDSNQALRQQYGVTIQTTLVLLDADGNAAKKYVAYDTPTLDAVVENLL